MNTPLSKYKVGFIGLRITKLGSSSKLLKKQGWMKLNHPAHNRNSFDYIKWVISKDKFNSFDWQPFIKNNLEAIAVWCTDAQWGKDGGITDKQWKNRIQIN